MKAYTYLVTIYAVIATSVIVMIAAFHFGGPKSGLPEDRYRFYTMRAEEMRVESLRFLADGNGDEYYRSLEAEKHAKKLAWLARDEYNRQLYIRLVRALAITGDQKMLQEAFCVMKLI